MSQNRISLKYGINRKTTARKVVFLGTRRKHQNEEFLKTLPEGSFSAIEFDEMETFEKSKCLPVSIPLAVVPETQFILGVRVAKMPAKGYLAGISREKYGLREDERPEAALTLFESIKRVCSKEVGITTDKNPKYPGWIEKIFPDARHVTVKGRRGCVVGQGELKSGGFDPLFWLNHTAAMFRANVNRLFRRTWCTTKRRDRLELHLQMYAYFHNHTLRRELTRQMKQKLLLGEELLRPA